MLGWSVYSQNYLSEINYNFSKRALGKDINQAETKNSKHDENLRTVI